MRACFPWLRARNAVAVAISELPIIITAAMHCYRNQRGWEWMRTRGAIVCGGILSMIMV